MWESGDIAYAHKIVQKVCLSALLIVSIGSSFLLVSGRNFIELWIGKDSFIGHGILIVFCIMIFFDTQNACLIECARATGKDKYGLMSMIAGFLNIILTFILIKPLGLLGVCLATLISLMLTENWYALYEPLARLKITLGEYVKKIILPIIGIFILSYTISFLINLSLSLSSWNSQRLSIVLTILSNVLVFLFMSYQLVLDKAQKNTIFGR
jgi:Na+-driven multidrug efflux pump